MTIGGKYEAFRHKMLCSARVLGVMLLFAINVFVIVTDHAPSDATSLLRIAAFVNHASDQHHVNDTPFTLRLSFRPATFSMMEAMASFPATPTQLTTANLWLLLLGFTIPFICFCFFSGEENGNTQFFPAAFFPPPEYRWSHGIWKHIVLLSLETTEEGMLSWSPFHHFLFNKAFALLNSCTAALYYCKINGKLKNLAWHISSTVSACFRWKK